MHDILNSPFLLFSISTYTLRISTFSFPIRISKTDRVKRKLLATTFTFTRGLEHKQSFITSLNAKYADIFEKLTSKLLSWKTYISIDFMVTIRRLLCVQQVGLNNNILKINHGDSSSLWETNFYHKDI